MKQPWMKYYPGDWRADAELRLCGLGARGLWIEMLGIMHEGNPRGSLLVNGKQPNPRQLAALSGAGIKEVEACLAELREAGVFSVDDDGTIFSRRMRRDVRKADEDKANGGMGGNPTLKPISPKGVNPPDKGMDKAQKLEARDQKSEQENKPQQRQPYDPADAAASKIDFSEERRRCEEAAGAEYPDFQVMIDLLQEGVDLDDRVLPVIRDVVEKIRKSTGDRPQRWAYFEKAIRDKNRVIRHAPKASIPATTKTIFVVKDSDQWKAWVKHNRGRTPPTYQRPADKLEGWNFASEWPPPESGSGSAECAS